MGGCERREREVMMAVNTKELPKIAANTSGTCMTQSTMTMDEFELEVKEQLLESLNVDAFISKLEIDSKVQSSHISRYFRLTRC